ncbi:plexin domain-containing protein 2-like [Prorops nasuta]|uniref:plexin domain-containing protein 2-like n=1 Tax=Prorops nasuta TaxID=863751 RepID=UPI0034CE61FD
MINMACERCCLKRIIEFSRIGRNSLALLLLTVWIGTSLAHADHDGSYYNYGMLETGGSSVEFRGGELSLLSDSEGDKPSVRNRRLAVEHVDALMEKPTEQAKKVEDPDLRPLAAAQQNVGANVPPQKSVNVPYQTETTTIATSTAVNYSSTEPTSPTTPESKKKPVVVSQPINPSNTTSSVTATTIIPLSPTVETTNDKGKEEKKDEKKDKPKDKEKPKDKSKEPDGKNNQREDSLIDDINISKFSDVTNKTLSQNNITRTEVDTHQYYNSTFIIDENVGRHYWVNLNGHPDLRVNELLSNSHRRAAIVKLKFDFPFYGHKVRNITIATGGFLYTGEYVHSWLAATQYIAPLMANFDTRLSNESEVKYADNGTAFTVEWKKVYLQDKADGGAFTFQVTLHENGDIVFVYSAIPVVIEEIEDIAHPVKVGLSDAYIMDRTVFFVRRKTIYEYHRVSFSRQDIKNWTVIYLKALPTCLGLDNCMDCLTKVSEFDCKWCSELNQCSTGTFRSRQDWLLKGCEVRNIKNTTSCPSSETSYKVPIEEAHEHRAYDYINTKDIARTVDSPQPKEPGTSPLEHARDNMSMSVSGVIGILSVIGLLLGLAGWAAYAYRNPHSASGQMLIRYRPSQWSWRRGEARYTAATIHM